MKKIIIPFFVILAFVNIGAQWEQISNSEIDNVKSVVLNDSKIIVGTEGSYESNILISADNGLSWLSRGISGKTITSLASDSSDIYAGTFYKGIYYSSDEGKNWISISSGLPEYLIVEAIYVNKSRIFAGTDKGLYISDYKGSDWYSSNIPAYSTVGSLYNTGSVIYACASNGLYRTNDSGINWKFMGLSRITRSVVVVNSTLIVATTDGIYYSSDDGNTWTKSQSDYQNDVMSLVVSGPDIFAATYKGIYKSSDAGKSWSSTGLGALQVLSLLINPANQTIYAATNAGFFHSTDNGLTWDILGPPGIKSIVSSSGDLCATTAKAGIYISSDKGITWKSRGLLGVNASSLCVDGNNIYVGSLFEGLYYSYDRGDTWSVTKEPYLQNIRSIFARDSAIYIGCYGGIYKSTDKAKSWIQVMNTASFGYSLMDINVISGKDSIMVAGFNDGVFISSVKRNNWKFIGGGMRYITSFLFAGSKIFAGNDSGVYVSVDNGYVWGAWNNGLSLSGSASGQSVLTMIKKDNEIFAGTYEGVYLSTDEGENWRNINGGFPYRYFESHYSDRYPEAQSIAVDEEYIYAATNDYGFCRCPLDKMLTDISTTDQVPVGYNLKQNYPNPFNPTTTIEYEISAASKVKVEVFDVLGRAVETLINKEQVSGKYSVTFNASRLSSGVYFYKITTDSFVQSKKMILLR